MSDPIDRAAEEFTRRFQHYDGYRSEARQADLLTVFKSGVQWAESQQAAHDAAVAAKALREAAGAAGAIKVYAGGGNLVTQVHAVSADALCERADRLERDEASHE